LAQSPDFKEDVSPSSSEKCNVDQDEADELKSDSHS
jgi:hypothetical protein